jgi:signal transduction histidine kinase/DNA-binding response OmpR family regulator/ligand-binding sensor domain-containing protein
MKINFRHIVLAISLVLSVSALYAESFDGMFGVRHIDRTDGLSSERVFSIVEDNDNVMWISTRTGVDRYNGRTVKNYALSSNYYYGDLAGRITRLYFDDKLGLLAYDHTGRIYKYQPNTDSFELYLFLGEYIEGEIILTKIFSDENGTLWFGLSRGLYSRKSDGTISCVIKDKYINDIACLGDSLFVGTSTGIFRLSYQDNFVSSPLAEGKNVQTLYLDESENKLWIGTFNSGLWALDLKNHSLHGIKGPHLSFLNPIRAITPYDQNRILVGIDGGGVYFVDKHTSETKLFVNTEDSGEFFLYGNGIYAITKDFQDNIWIGSYTGGVSVAISLTYPIHTMTHERGNPQSLVNNNVNDVEENTNNDLWFATDDGISIRNKSDHRWKHILKSIVIVDLCKSDNGNIWAGTYGDGLYLIDKAGRVIRHLTQNPGGLTTNYIFSVKEDKGGDVWIGGLNGNLIIIDQQGKRKNEFDINWVHSIEEVDSVRMAVATVNGFCIVEKQTSRFSRYATTREFNNKNVSAYIISMLFNGDGTVWLGTEGGGLNLYDMNSGDIKTITTKEGLLSDDIYSLQRDNKGRIWASTGKGLAVVNDMKVSNLNYIHDTDKTYNKSACIKLSDGRFAYGSTNGAIFITPDAMAVEKYEAPVRITDLKLEYISPEKEIEMRPAIYDMLMDKKVELDYSHNSFSVTFESINYRFQHDIAYQYILEGYEKSWSAVYSNGTVRYTNVSPGMYTLKVRSLRKSNGEIISEDALSINIDQPWWNSWYAWIIYLSLVFGIFYFILRYKSNQLQKRHNEDKIKFFIETAHDIRTPVTLIMAPLEDLSKEKGLSEEVSYLLETARNNTRKLHTLVSQLLEFEKIDTNRENVTLKPVNINDLLVKECVSFQSYCDKKQLHIKMSLPEHDVFAMADEQMMEMLLDNLISNACKYTLANGTISLSLSTDKKHVMIEVQDTGIGIPADAGKHLFKNVYRTVNARETNEPGTGFGLLQVQRLVNMMHGKISYKSEINKGSTFYVTLRKADIDSSFDNNTVHKQISPAPDNTKEYMGDDAENIKEPSNTLLIVEDNDELRCYLRKIFEHDYLVIDVSDGSKALECLSEEYPDLILSDVMMPGIQGDELCRIVKENPQTSGIPFILLTAKVTHDAMITGLKSGADDYIPKPFSAEILRLKVHSILETRNHLREYVLKNVVAQIEKNETAAAETLGSGDEIRQTDECKVQQEAVPVSENDLNFIKCATQLVIDNMEDEEFNINQLCQEMAMSRTLFYNRLKSLTGKAPQDFIRLIRLQRAAELLKQGKPVTDVAAETGFVNAKYFSILFKKQFGISPSKFMEQN